MFIPFLKSHFEHVCINATKRVILRLGTFNKQTMFIPNDSSKNSINSKVGDWCRFPIDWFLRFRPPWQPSIVNIWLHPCTLKKCLSVSLLINEYITIRFRALIFLDTYLHVLRHIPQCLSVRLTLISCYTSTQYPCGCSQASVLYDVFFNVCYGGGKHLTVSVCVWQWNTA